MGGFHVTSQDRYFLFDTVIVLEQKSTEAFLVQGGLLSEVFTRRSLKRYFSRRSTKQQWQVHGGDTFQPQGLTPAPMTRRTSSIFSPRRFCLSAWTIFSAKEKKPKDSEQNLSVKSRYSVSLFISAQLPRCFVFYVRVLTSMYSFFNDYFCTWLLSCIVHRDAKSILEIKISTKHINDYKWNPEAGFLFCYINFTHPRKSS